MRTVSTPLTVDTPTYTSCILFHKDYSQRGKIAPFGFGSRAKRVFAFCGSIQDHNVNSHTATTARASGSMNIALRGFFRFQVD